MGKKYKIVYLPVAQNDLTGIIEYIRLDSPESALNMLQKFDDSISRLGKFPFTGVTPKDRRLELLGYKILVIGNYLVFYVVRDDVIEIRRIIHGKRNYEFLL
jgi:addiction module RelE/StbE family toxin